MKYKIWNREDYVITPSGEIFSPIEWIQRYPAANVVKTVLVDGEVNGAFFGVFSQMIEMYEGRGCDFTGCEEDQDYLDKMDEFDRKTYEESMVVEITPEERIAAALEAQVMMSLPDED